MQVGFNNNPKHFEPTDVLDIGRGKSVTKELRRTPWAFLLDHPQILSNILFFNGFNPGFLNCAVERKTWLVLNHHKMYLQEFRSHPCYQAYRNRSFALLKWKIERAGLGRVLPALKKKSRRRVRVLDIGCGSGRTLMELSREFPMADTFGVCLPGEKERVSRVRSFFDLDNVQAPKIAGKDLNVDSLIPGPFDFVFSLATIRYIRDKISLIEEIHRRLRRGGVAAIELQLLRLIGKNNAEIDLKSFFEHKKWRNQFRFDPSTGLLFVFKKSTAPVDLGLELSSNRSSYRAPHPIPEQNAQVGWSSVYLAR